MLVDARRSSFVASVAKHDVFKWAKDFRALIRNATQPIETVYTCVCVLDIRSILILYAHRSHLARMAAGYGSGSSRRRLTTQEEGARYIGLGQCANMGTKAVRRWIHDYDVVALREHTRIPLTIALSNLRHYCDCTAKSIGMRL